MNSRIASPELDRQYRVLRQTMDIHSVLRDRYALWSRTVEIVLVGCSVVFCATTFADASLYSFFGLSPNTARILLGLVSVVAFGASLVVLLSDWETKSQQHADAVRRWSDVLRGFRESSQPDGTYDAARIVALSASYWDTANGTIQIPAGSFNKLKSKYLIKCEISRLKSVYPGCPRLILWLIVRVTGTWAALRDAKRQPVEDVRSGSSSSLSEADGA